MSEEVKEVEGAVVPQGIPVTEAQLIEVGIQLGASLKKMLIKDDESFEGIAEPMKKASAHSKMLEAHRKDHLKPVREYVTKVNEEYKRATDELEAGLRHAKAEISAYQHKVEEERRKAAEAEAARIQRNAEKRAERAEEKGDGDAAQRAEDIRMQAEMEAENAKAAIATQEKPKAAGVSTRKNWKAEVTDLKAFIGAIAAGNDPRLKADLLKVNQPAINKLVKALEDGLKDVPGLRVFYEDVVSVRSK